MRLFQYLTATTLLLGVTSALVVPNRQPGDIATRERRSSGISVPETHFVRQFEFDAELVARAATYKKKTPPNNRKSYTPPKAAKVSFSGGARKHLDNLGLHGKERQNVKKYHSKIVKQEMKGKGAASAQIKHLAHTEGSVDPKMHITANLWDANNKRIKSSYGTPPKKGDLHHLYTGSKPLPQAYVKAVNSKGGGK